MILPPFEMALRAGARSVMNSYTDTRRRPGRRRRGTAHRRCCATTLGFTGHGRRRLLLGRVPADAAPRGATDRRGGPARPRRRHRRRAAVDERVRRAAARARSPTGSSTRSWSTGRCRGCCARSASSACSTPDWAPGRGGGRSTSTTPESRAARAGARPALGRAARQRRHPAARSRGDGSPWSGRAPTRPRRCSAATPSRCTSACTTPGSRAGLEIRTVREALADDLRRHLRPGLPGPRWQRRGHRRPPSRVARGRRRLRRRARRRGRPVRQRHLGRGLRRRDLDLPGRQEELLEALLAPARRSSRCCSSAGPTTSAGRSTGWPASCAGSSPARRARRRSPTCSAAGSTRPAGCR